MSSSYSSVRYSRLEVDNNGTDEVGKDRTLEVEAMESGAFDFNSVFTYDKGNNSAVNDRYRSDNNYNSAFKWSGVTSHTSLNIDGSSSEVDKRPSSSLGLVITTWIFTLLSYLLLVLTVPISYWILVRKLGEFERVVVFRLGRMIGVKGPGRVIIFPWMDRFKKIDVRTAAFAVPPQQFITCDGGIVEMGAEIQFGIVDVVTMISNVADHQDILRSLGKTILVKLLVKKTVQQLQKDKRLPAQVIMDELNDQVRKWGIDVHKVELSDPKILKQPESSSNAAVGSILKGLGMKGEPSYPTPEEFVRTTHGVTENGATNCPSATFNPLDSHVSAMGCLPPPEIPPGVNSCNMNVSLLQMMATKNNATAAKMNTDLPETAASTICNWGRCLDVILQSEFCGQLEEEAVGLYHIEITETETGKETYYVELSPSVKCVKKEVPEGNKPDVSVTISSPDLANILNGSLAPLQAYLTGRIHASGDIRKLVFFDKLSKRGHKPGAMFNI